MHFPTYKYNIIWIALIFVGCYVSEIAEFWPFYMVRGGRKGGVAERVVWPKGWWGMVPFDGVDPACPSSYVHEPDLFAGHVLLYGEQGGDVCSELHQHGPHVGLLWGLDLRYGAVFTGPRRRSVWSSCIGRFRRYRGSPRRLWIC
jgi:hypothetical protein